MNSKLIIQTPNLSFEIAEGDLMEPMTWSQAKEACISLGNGWRLPTKVELSKMMELHEQGTDLGFTEDYYWSSTMYSWDQYYIQSLCFSNDLNMVGWEMHRVRVVRSIEPVTIRLKDATFEIAISDFPELLNWEEAKRECTSIGEGWRLPTMRELGMMAINKEIIGNINQNYYWSSYEDEENNNYAWVQNFFNIREFCIANNKLSRTFVRAVRDIKK